MWVTTDGLHRGSNACRFADGKLGANYQGDTVFADYDQDGLFIETADGLGIARPQLMVIGWKAMCECGWHGPEWARTLLPHEQDPVSRVIFSTDAFLDGELEDLIRADWRAHAAGPEALYQVRDAAERLRGADTDLAAAVVAARAAGSSWDEIARTSGLTSRQAAQQRWGHRTATGN